MVAGGDCLQRRSLVVDDDGLFISGPAVVEILHDNWPWIRCFRFFQMRVRVDFWTEPLGNPHESPFRKGGPKTAFQSDEGFPPCCTRICLLWCTASPSLQRFIYLMYRSDSLLKASRTVRPSPVARCLTRSYSPKAMASVMHTSAQTGSSPT